MKGYLMRDVTLRTECGTQIIKQDTEVDIVGVVVDTYLGKAFYSLVSHDIAFRAEIMDIVPECYTTKYFTWENK